MTVGTKSKTQVLFIIVMENNKQTERTRQITTKNILFII